MPPAPILATAQTPARRAAPGGLARCAGTPYWLATAGLFAAGLYLVFAATPTEASMGPVQKIFYLHLPTAINTFLAFLVVFVASIGYLWQRRQEWDDLAQAAARVGVLLCSVVLLTGMIWARSAWGQWWTWSPRLTFSLVLWLLYVVYLMIRPSIEGRQRRALFSAVYGIVAFVDVPLVYLSVRLIPDIHPTSIELEPAMQRALLFWFLPVTLLAAGLIVARYRLERRLAEEPPARPAAGRRRLRPTEKALDPGARPDPGPGPVTGLPGALP